MAKTSGKIRWHRVAKARARIESGFYDDPAILDKILRPRLSNHILLDLDKCRVGNGDEYRDLVSETLSQSLAEIVDTPMSRCEFRAAGGRGDIELAVRTENLENLHLWSLWATKYDIRNIIVETKNEAKRARVEDVSQLAGYLNQVGVGHFGILVARAGFSRNAIQNLGAIAKGGQNLIIPLEHHHLGELAKAARKGSTATMEYLRRRETLLLQVS